MEYNEIVNLMQRMTKLGLTRIRIEHDNFKLELEKATASNSDFTSDLNKEQTSDLNIGSSQESSSLRETEVSKSIKPNLYDATDMELPGTKKILSPMVGTFYAQPAPDKPPFVSVGDIVNKGQSVCIIEAMKLMNEIESEVTGEVIKCLVENEDMVEFGQPLFLLK